MERWRSFFAQAEADLWTIIHQAILLAAADFPAEFKHRRCEIAEALFARRPCPSPRTRSVDATVISGSVITNSTGDGEKKVPYEACWKEDNDLRNFDASQGEVKVADTLFYGTMTKPSAAERHSRSNDKVIELDTCLRSSKDIPEAARGLAMDSIVLQNVSMIKDQIMGSANQSEDGLLRSLHALEHLDITVDTLKATEIGREINKFRKHPSGPVRNLVKQLVRSWKGMVDEWVKNAEISQPLSASGDIANREVSAVRHANVQSEASAQRSCQLSKQSSNKATVCCASTVRVPLHTGHAVEEMGSSRVESDELYRPGLMERKVNSCGQQVQFSRCIATQSSNGSLGPGRPSNSTLETEKVFRNGSLAYEHVKKAEEESGTYVQNLSTLDYKTCGAIKRQIAIEDQHAVRAKKYRDMQPSSSPELSKTGFLSARLPASAKPQRR
ncbi:hypothetical protein GOP47_0005269 [Adiantum capillus-veneris]|uniref:TFIIS N-terminal domain-containing protein n=1 Tax=Adiantum capillus-veneris TaxID=13818 RepID=A0A9D4V5E5_ADICA|nr:hypothetical protein GOP47_0005269 [Adiantum capillus-veneris]